MNKNNWKKNLEKKFKQDLGEYQRSHKFRIKVSINLISIFLRNLIFI